MRRVLFAISRPSTPPKHPFGTPKRRFLLPYIHTYIRQVCDKFDLQPRGSAGEHSAAVGDKFDVSNKQRLGFTEVELVQKMIDGVTRVIALERAMAAGEKDIAAVKKEISAH